jgi:hypothetical protein
MTLISIFAPILCAILLVWVLSRLIVSKADEDRQAREVGNGQIEFAPNRRSYWGVYLFVAFLAYVTLSMVVNGLKEPGNLIGAGLCTVLALIVLAAFPGSILVSGDGVRQVYWLWKNKRVDWKDVARIAVDEKQGTVTITGARGTKIVHTRQLPDRTRLLEELQKHCGEKLTAKPGQKTVSSL